LYRRATSAISDRGTIFSRPLKGLRNMETCSPGFVDHDRITPD
jgi:hypothetical protein